MSPPPHPHGVGYPRERPDFEPPPQWAQPGPSMPGPPPGVPFGSRLAPEPPPRQTRLGAIIAVVAAVALVTAIGGAAFGAYGALRWFNPAELDSQQPINDGLGAKQKSAFPKPQDVSTVAKSVLPGVVQIKVSASEGKATGSGFVIREDGHILTNNHVIAMAAGADGGQIDVAFQNGEERTAKIVGRSPSYDLAVIKVGGAKLQPVPLGDSDGIIVGEPVVAIGSPLGLAGTVTSGIISARNRAVTAGGEDETSFISALQTDAAINPGNSGGPLVNLKAEVIGVNSAIATLGSDDSGFGEQEQQGNIGLGFAIPINQARRTADQIIRTGHAVYPVVGATIDRSFEGPGARISEVMPDSGAQKAGLRRGDLVTVINGHKVTGADDLIVQIRSQQPGQRVRITYERAGKPQDVMVTLGEERDKDR
jgi:putative serine protease PepD